MDHQCLKTFLIKMLFITSHTILVIKLLKNVKQIKDYYVQCCGYAYAHNELFGTDIKQIVILITVAAGGAQIFTGNMQHYLPDLKHRVNKYHELFRRS